MEIEIPIAIIRFAKNFGVSEANLMPTNFFFYVVIPYVVTVYALRILMKRHLKIFKGSAEFVNTIFPILIAFMAIRLISVAGAISSLYLMFIEKWPFTQGVGPFKATSWIRLIARFVFWVGAYYLYFTLPPILVGLILSM